MNSFTSSEYGQQPQTPEPQSSASIQATAIIEDDGQPIGTPEECRNDAIRFAEDLFRKTPDWVTFYREVLGVDGRVRRNFSTTQAIADFERTEEYAQIQQMVAKLRERSKSQGETVESTRVITVRMPQSLHEALRAEAHERRTSMNKLCISKLLQMIDEQFVPTEK